VSHPPIDVLIIGSGLAGLSLAVRLAPHARIALLCKGPLAEGSSYYAQGGVSAVVDEGDSIASHVEDTLNAGAGLCDPAIVEFTAERGPACIEWLVEHGVPFSTEDGVPGHRLHLTREGGHSHRRVVHAADATGRAIQTTLTEFVRNHPQITLLENYLAVDLITAGKLKQSPERVVGSYVLNRRTGRVETVRARFVVLATGGASKVYLYTTNPDSSTGDGIAMAWRAGCRVANMEFNQFHPTCLYHPQTRSFLITEAMRGEGGRLLLPGDKSFMHQFDGRGELAPRDIVARAIDHEMKRLGIPCVYLDIRHKGREFITSHFPNIHQHCQELGIDITQHPIPVVPAAHYTCGGVITDRYGHTDIANLYAIGEVACTGLHGANRLASNSLLECLVFAESASVDILQKLNDVPPPLVVPDWDESRVTDSDEQVVVSHNWQELRRFMWDYVGIVRTDKRLQRAKRRVDMLIAESTEYYSHFRIDSDLIELRNLSLVADLIIRCAQQRCESRGLHYTLDYPQLNQAQPARNSILAPLPGAS
jgi:L-aspartate oxidase